MEDEKIIELFWRRNQAAILEVQKKYGRYCYKVAKNILRSREDAEECVNDAYLTLWQSIPPKRPPNLFAYLISITRNGCFKALRRENAQKRGGGQYALALEELSELLPSRETVEGECDARLLAEELSGFIGELPYDDRMIFLGRYWLAMPIAEIAQRLHFTKSKVKSSLFRSRQKLEKHLMKEELI